MLIHILALAVGLGSIALYISAFFFPEIHRKNDFIWSGVGLFYALTLWIFSPRITGGLFLGHIASVALLGYFGWQTVQLRRQVTPQVLQTSIPSNTPEQVVEESVEKKSVISKLTQPIQAITGIFSRGKGQSQPISNVQNSGIVQNSETVSEESSSDSTSLDKAAIDAITEAEPTDNADKSVSDESNSETSSESNLQDSERETNTAVTEEESSDSDMKTELNSEDTSSTAESITEIAEDLQNNETPEAIPPESPPEELVEAAQTDEIEGKEMSPVEEISPEAQLTPPEEVSMEIPSENKSDEDKKQD